MTNQFKRPGLTRALLLSLMFVPSALMAQGTPRLSLFETVDTPAQQGSQDIAVNPSAPSNNVVQFVLVGTSQIGDKQRARLRTPDGQTVTLDLNTAGPTTIPGYAGYEVNLVAARELVIQHPSSAPCVPSRDQGVACTGTHQARLQLATATPLVREQPANNNGQAQQADVASAGATAVGSPDGTQQPENPFAAALRAARERGEVPDAAAARAEGARFRARRIDPADVPPGAQLIRTPFGDRIVVQ